MKHLILSAFALLSVAAQAQTMVNVEKADGSTVAYRFSDNPVLTLDGNNIVMTSDTQSDTYAISAVNQFTITTSVAVTSITLDATTAEMTVEDTKQLTATVAPADATNAGVTWTTSDATVATVSADGLITAVAAGTATITATAADGSGVSATCEVTVSAKQEEPQSDIEASTDISQYDNVLYFNDVESRAGDFNLELRMKNAEENITAFQCDVYLPDGVEWKTTTDKRGNVSYDLPTFNEDRTDTSYHTITPIAKNADGSYNIIVYSMDLAEILETDGVLMTLPLTISEDMAAGDYNIMLKNIVMTNTSKIGTSVDKVVSKLTIPSYIIGDANGDDIINVTDIVSTIAYIRGDDSDFAFAAADVNADGVINVTDVVNIIALIREEGSSAAKAAPSSRLSVKRKTSATGESNLEILPYTITAGTTSSTVKLNMNNPGDAFTAFQCDVVFPEGISWATYTDKRGNVKYTQPTFDADADRTDASYHTVDAGINTDGNMNIIVYSTEQEVILDEEGAVLDLPFVYDANLAPGVYDITLTNMVMTRTDKTDTKPADYTFSVIVGAPEQTSVALSGNYTDEAIAELNTSLADNAAIAAVDMSNAKAISSSTAITGANKNLLVVIPEDATIKNTTNVVKGDVCADLVITDGNNFAAPMEFTATKATYSREMTNEWGTICLPYEVKSGDDVEYYSITAVNGSTLEIEKLTTVAAGTPALVHKVGGSSVICAAENVAVSGAISDAAGVTMVGSYTNDTKVADSNAFYIKNDKFWRCNDYFYIDAFRAYFVADSNVKAGSLTIGDAATAINALTSGTDVESVYGADGTVRTTVQRGMNIIRMKDGKTVKVMVK